MPRTSRRHLNLPAMTWMIAVTAFWFACGLASGQVRNIASRPNIIVIMPDDMGYGDLAVTGNPVIRTPYLDRLAGESAWLTHFYVSPVCSPTRASLMTGRYNYRTRVVDTFKGRSMMEPDEVTVAEMLREAGYATGIFGKWHLGDHYPMRPQDQGFDEVLVHRGGGLGQPSEPIQNEGRYTNPILFRNGVAVQTAGYCTDVYFNSAIDFMRRCQAADQPFFVFLPPNAPHGPFHDVPDDLLAHYQSIDLSPVLGKRDNAQHVDQVARVYAMVENIDENVGRLDAFLDESGQRDGTLVLFLTDNGPASDRFVGPFRGKKSDVHEGGIRTVFFARWPGHFPAGSTSDRIAAHIDVLPTLMAAAGEQPPADVAIDGRNLMPLLRGDAVDWPDRTLVLQTHRGDVPVPEHHVGLRTQDWKLVRPSGFGRETPTPDVAWELYRLGADSEELDSAEMDDRSAGSGDVLSRLKQDYVNWFEDVSSTRPGNFDPPRIVIGSDAETLSDLSIQDWRVGDQAGWGGDGRWLVDVVDRGPYRAMVRWDSPVGTRTVTLRVGASSFTAELIDGESTVVWPSIELPVGEASIHVDVEGESLGRNELFRFVTLERLP